MKYTLQIRDAQKSQISVPIGPAVFLGIQRWREDRVKGRNIPGAVLGMCVADRNTVKGRSSAWGVQRKKNVLLAAIRQ